MAILAELFLVLAGYDSDISQRSSIHPAEKEVLDRALRFGRLVSRVNEVASTGYVNSSCRVVKEFVCLRYLRELADLEAAIISQVTNQAGSLEDSLFYSARIIAESVEKWTLLFEFSEEILERIDSPDNLMADWISSQVSRNGSYHGFRELGTEILIAMDRAWLKELCEILVDGKLCRPDFLHHNALKDPSVLESASKCISQLNIAAEEDPNLLKSVLEMAEQNEILVCDQLKAPLDPVQCSNTLKIVHKNVSDVVRKHFLFTEETSALWQLLKSVVLIGSPIFLANLAVSSGDTEEALASYFETDKDLHTNILLHGPKLLYTETQDSGITPIKIRISESLEFVLTKEQCLIYETLFGWLARVALAGDSIGIGSGGNVGHAYKLMFDLIWNHYQSQIDAAFAQLHAALETEDGIDVLSEHDKTLKKIVKSLLLDSKEYRASLNKAITGCAFGDVRPLSELTALLEDTTDLHRLDLTPFRGFLQL